MKSEAERLRLAESVRLEIAAKERAKGNLQLADRYAQMARDAARQAKAIEAMEAER